MQKQDIKSPNKKNIDDQFGIFSSSFLPFCLDSSEESYSPFVINKYKDSGYTVYLLVNSILRIMLHLQMSIRGSTSCSSHIIFIYGVQVSAKTTLDYFVSPTFIVF